MMYVDYYEKKTSDKGIGVFAKKFIPEDTLIWELTEARKFTKEQYKNLPEDVKKDAYPHDDYYVQAVGKGESWNHSCDANTWWVSDNKLSALRDISPNEEITYDYATTDINPTIVYTWECKCRSPKCRKKLHWNDILKPELYKKYKGHLPSWVEKFVSNFTS